MRLKPRRSRVATGGQERPTKRLSLLFLIMGCATIALLLIVSFLVVFKHEPKIPVEPSSSVEPEDAIQFRRHMVPMLSHIRGIWSSGGTGVGYELVGDWRDRSTEKQILWMMSEVGRMALSRSFIPYTEDRRRGLQERVSELVEVYSILADGVEYRLVLGAEVRLTSGKKSLISQGQDNVMLSNHRRGAQFYFEAEQFSQRQIDKQLVDQLSYAWENNKDEYYRILDEYHRNVNDDHDDQVFYAYELPVFATDDELEKIEPIRARIMEVLTAPRRLDRLDIISILEWRKKTDIHGILIACYWIERIYMLLYTIMMVNRDMDYMPSWVHSSIISKKMLERNEAYYVYMLGSVKLAWCILNLPKMYTTKFVHELSSELK